MDAVTNYTLPDSEAGAGARHQLRIPIYFGHGHVFALSRVRYVHLFLNFFVGLLFLRTYMCQHSQFTLCFLYVEK